MQSATESLFRVSMDVGIFLKSAGLIFYSSNAILGLSFLIKIYIHLRPLRSNVSVLLVCNTYLNICLVSTIMTMMHVYAITSALNPSNPIGGRWCELRTYISYVCFSALFHSFVLQALFRLFRIVFYRRKNLQSFSVSMFGILIQWLLASLLILPHLLLNDFEVLPNEYNCSISFENIRGQLMATLNTFSNPLSVVLAIYAYIIRYTRRAVAMQQQQQNSNKRDLAVLKRIIIVFLMVAGIGMPTSALILVAVITHRPVPFSMDIQGLCISLGLFIATISMIFTVPQIQQIFRRNRNQLQPQTQAFQVSLSKDITKTAYLKSQIN